MVRHGDAFAGLRGIIAGERGCRGLTELGRNQAQSLHDRVVAGDGPRVDVIVSSRLPRAIETAAVVAPAYGGPDVVQHCDLCEVHVGEADGMDWDDYAAEFGEFNMILEPDRPFAPGGDSWNGFHERAAGAMNRLAREHPGRTVMAFSHAGLIAAMLRVSFGGDSAAGPRLVPSNTGLTTWEFDEGAHHWTLRSYDDAWHLTSLDRSSTT